MKECKNLRKKLFLGTIILVFVLSVFVSAGTLHAAALSGGSSEESTVSCITDKTHYLTEEYISVDFTVHTVASISEFSCTPSGFVIVSSELFSENEQRICLVLSATGEWERGGVSIDILLSTGETLNDAVYAYKNDQGVFLSIRSALSAYETYLIYAVEEGMITWEECEALFAERGSGCVEESVSTSLLPASIGNITSTNSTSVVDTYASGTITWKDDWGNEHPLRGVKVEVYDNDPIGDDLLGTVYTNDQGMFYLGFENDMASDENGRDLRIRIFAGDDNIMVKTLLGIRYSYRPDIGENDVAINTNTEFNVCFHMDDVMDDDDLIQEAEMGHAMQISQAVLTARDYAKAMMGTTPTPVTVKYPGDIIFINEGGCFYDSVFDHIHITDELYPESPLKAYASWDVIMHEYGHHLQYQLDITDNPGDEHWVDYNQIRYYYEHADEYPNQNHKEEGVKLAWAEGWATAFGLVAQDYHKTVLTGINFVNNGQYDSYRLEDPSLVETSQTYLGEGSESSIIAVLWDLFDPTNSQEPSDTINLDYQGFWNVTTISGTYTFSDFFNNFISAYPQHRFAVGNLLSQYEMASSVPYRQETANNGSPHTILFNAQGGSTYHPNNDFIVYVYDQNGTRLFTATYAASVGGSTTDLYQITFYDLHWRRILEAPGATYSVQISASQDDSYPTGGYLSGLVTINKPTGSKPASLGSTISISATDRYKEYVSTLQPGQTYEYWTTFAASGTYVIQTFGTRDTKITISKAHEEAPETLACDDDSGYSTNAFLSFTVTAGTKYVISVELVYAPSASNVKTVFTPTDTAYSSYESFAGGGNNNSSHTTSVSTHDAVYYRYTSSDSELWIGFEADATFDSYLYLIDPRSAKPITEDIDDYTIDYEYGSGNYGAMASDYGGSGTDAQFCQRLEAGVPYLVIVTAYNPNAQSGILNLRFDTFES